VKRKGRQKEAVRIRDSNAREERKSGKERNREPIKAFPTAGGKSRSIGAGQ